MDNKDKGFFDSANNTVGISAKVSAGVKAKLLNEAKEQGLTLSQYIAHVLSIEGENQKEVLTLRAKVRDLETKVQTKHQAFTQEAVNSNLDVMIGLQDTLADMQGQLQALYDNQPQDLKDRIAELEDELDDARLELADYENNAEEVEEEEDDKEEVEDEEEEEAEAPTSQTRIIAELCGKMNEMRKQHGTNCTQSQSAGEEAIVKMAIERFTQVVNLIAKDYTWKDKIKKTMWAQFRGLPDKKHAWNLVINPYAEVKS
jgi:chromosome segregation ATPase